MMNFKSKSPVRTPEIQHEPYQALCALAASGSLTDPEWIQLQSHLGECESCKKLLQEYREMAKTGMALLMPDTGDGNYATDKSWSVESAKQELFTRIASGEAAGHLHVPLHQTTDLTRGWRRLSVSAPSTLLRYAVAVVLVAAMTFAGYRLGHKQGQGLGRSQLAVTEVVPLRSQLDRLLQERASLQQRLDTKGGEIERLSQELKRQTAQVAKWKSLQAESEQAIQKQGSQIAALNSEKSTIALEREAFSRKVQESQASLDSTQGRLDALREQRQRELLHTASLENQVSDLSARLKASEETLQQHEQFLAYDRDIRELMGARELYIADVFDVGADGSMRKPYGRIFYTRQKSLIFYAFDLDQQPGVRNAVFQAWGRRGPTDKQPLNLGILYLDNDTNKRWALRFDDPKVLAQIDAVFVTIEPGSGNRKPSGKQLLFASLRTPPNHP